MTSIMFTVAEGTTVETFQTALATGDVKFYRVRDNETTRHIPYLAPETPERETAEWVLEQREEGTTMAVLAKALHASVPAVRRMINGALLAQEVEEMEAEDIADILALAAESTTEA